MQNWADSETLKIQVHEQMGHPVDEAREHARARIGPPAPPRSTGDSVRRCPRPELTISGVSGKDDRRGNNRYTQYVL